MLGFIDNFDFLNIESQKYWSFPSSYNMAKRKEQLNIMLYSNDYCASEKKDGYWQMVLKDEDGNLFMRARNSGVNGWICKQEWVPHLNNFFNNLPNGTCLLTEVYLPNKTSKAITTILGCGKEKAIQRQQDGNYLRMYIFDVLAWNGLDIHSKSIIERINFLNELPSDDFVDIATYWFTPEEIHENWLSILSQGGEGVVLTRKDNSYEPGKRTARHTLKLKKELQDTVDVFLTGRYKKPTKLYTGDSIETWEYWYDELKEEKISGKILFDRVNNDSIIPVTRLWFNNMAAAVEIAMIVNNQVTPVGWISGVSDIVRKGIVENPEEYKGKVIELQAMEIDVNDSIPSFRHAKIVNWRTDEEKIWKDCVWMRDGK